MASFYPFLITIAFSTFPFSVVVIVVTIVVLAVGGRNSLLRVHFVPIFDVPFSLLRVSNSTLQLSLTQLNCPLASFIRKGVDLTHFLTHF